MQETIKYKNLQPYKYPRDYYGQSWFGWFAVISQTRDSNALDRSNYRRVLEDLRKLDSELLESDIDSRQLDYDSPRDSTVTDTSVNHWACGWAEIIYVHSSNKSACQKADEILSALQDYPVYDESDFSELETSELQEYWEHCGMQERVDICKRAGGSIFAARAKSYFDLPEDVYQYYTDHYTE